METTLNNLRQTYGTGQTRSYGWRMETLSKLKRLVTENQAELVAAMRADLGRSAFEADALDLIPLIMEVDHAMANLSYWMQPEYGKVPMIMSPATSETRAVPLGVTLIIGPFNYPINLLLCPLIGAISAGNCAVIKPSEMATACETIMKQLIEQYLPKDCFRVITGDYKVSAALLKLRWDKIFFTGSTRVGQIVLEAASKFLTPVVLELGGKSPVVIDESVTDITLASRRIMWGKLANCGQTCIAPDYVLCHESKYDELLVACKERVAEFYGAQPKNSEDFARIITTQHAERLKKILDAFKGRVVTGGSKECDVSARYIPPTVLADVTLDSSVMKEELFGPILPVLKYSNVDEAIDIINADSRYEPLALYVFSKSRPNIDRVTNAVQAGGIVINDTLFGAGSSYLPFGGVGRSGMGRYHGKDSFDAFSHRQSVLRRHDWWWLDVPFRFPPYHDFGLTVFKAAAGLPAQPHANPTAVKLVLVASLVAAGGYFFQGYLGL